MKKRASTRPAEDAAQPETPRQAAAWFAPEPIIRLEILRFFTPLAILGFLSSRIAYTDQWISEDGFCLPNLGTQDVHEAIYLPPIPAWVAWFVAALLVVCGLSVTLGYKTRASAGAFAALLAYVAMADRLAAFTVSRIAPMVALVICLSPAGTRFSVDAWFARRRLRGKEKVPGVNEASGGTIRFFQAFLVVFYTASGICKARGDWLKEPAVLWTHLHDSYQTAFTLLLANSLPSSMWTAFQAMTLAFECGALAWLVSRRLRPFGLAFGLGMHLLIGLMFGPVLWFSMLMMTLLSASFLPKALLERLTSRLAAHTDL